MKDHDDDDRPEPKKRYHRCKDRTCGALDCPTCYPNTYDEATEEETTEAA
jgi:hypothetical protein